MSSQPTVQRKDPTTRKWFRRSPYELSLRARLATFAVLVLICYAVFEIRGREDPFLTGFLFAALLINPVDWIIQGWRESAARENR